MRNSSIDKVTLRVVGGAFDSIAKEMAHVLYRMSNSSIIRESEDIGCGIFDATGQELCESETSPMHIGSLPFYIRGFMRKLEGKISDGDIIIHNQNENEVNLFVRRSFSQHLFSWMNDSASRL